MKANTPGEMIRKIVQSVQDMIGAKAGALTVKSDGFPLQFIRVSEKFDVVQRSPYKGWVLRHDRE